MWTVYRKLSEFVLLYKSLRQNNSFRIPSLFTYSSLHESRYASLNNRYSRIERGISVPNLHNISNIQQQNMNYHNNLNYLKKMTEMEAPFIHEIRLSIEIWLKHLTKSELLLKTSQLSNFIQFKYESSKNKWLHKGNDKYRGMNLNNNSNNNNNLNGFNNNSNNNYNNRSRNNTKTKVTLSNFTLLKVVGKGAFGKVLQVRNINNDKILAMKILKKENVIKRNQVEHTKTERRVLGYIEHPFIVGLKYAFQTDSKLYLVLEYAPGGELFFHLGKEGRFKESRAKFYAAEITLALEYLHSKDIIYRDLKPENVLLDENGHVKITDFGLSKENINGNNLAHSFCGTPEYLAPEILRRSGHGKPSDWWSLGALLYEMLTGMPPFYSRDRDRLFEKILHSKLRFPNYFSHSTCSILTQLMNRNPKKRLGSINDALDVKKHEFFNNINWQLLLQLKIKAPFKPKLKIDPNTGCIGTTNFDPEFTGMQIHSISDRINYNGSKRKYLLPFEDFSFNREDYNSSLQNYSDEINNINDII